MRRSVLSLLAFALLLGSAAAQMAAVSGMRAKFLRKHPHLAKTLVPVSGAPGSGGITPTAVPTQCLSVAEVAQQAGNFSALLAAAQAAGLSALLSDRGLVATVFAPTDEAFASALDSLGLTAEELLAQPTLVAAVLKYHVVPYVALSSRQISDGLQLPTLLSADLAAAAAANASASWHKKGGVETGKLTPDVTMVYDLKKKEAFRNITISGSLSSAAVVLPDVQAGCPSVVHVIDAVLLPDLAGDDEEEQGMWGSLMRIWGA